MTRDEILQEIDEYLDFMMENPLPASEVENGWDAEHQQKAIMMMNGIREALRKGTALPKWSIVRTIDSWGLQESYLLERALYLITSKDHNIETSPLWPLTASS